MRGIEVEKYTAGFGSLWVPRGCLQELRDAEPLCVWCCYALWDNFAALFGALAPFGDSGVCRRETDGFGKGVPEQR